MQKYNYGGYPPPILPGMEDYILSHTHSTEDSELTFSPSSAKVDPFYNSMCECCNFSSNWQMPIVGCVTDTRVLGHEIIGYDRISISRSRNYGVHFYIHDCKNLSSLRSAIGVYNRIKNHPFVIGPDYSVRMNMPFPQKLNNSFNIKLVTAWYQHMGLLAVPNVVWADESHMSAYLEGYPIGSVIAINSTGIGIDKRSIENWIIGYNYVIDILKPIAIIRYGVKISGEIESISYYKQNDNFKSCNYGW